MTTTQSAKTTIYYVPYVGNAVPIYDGSSLTMTSFTELSVATTDTTKSPTAIGASKVNDWFIWDDAGTIRLGHGPDWTSDTARSAGTALTLVNGIWLNNASITNGPAAQRGTYVGTTRSNASSTLDWILPSVASGGSQGVLSVWNAYNRVLAGGMNIDTSSSWTYNSTTARLKNGGVSTNNYVSFVSGLQEDLAIADNKAFAQNSATSGFGGIVGIGVDSTTAFSGVTGQSSSGIGVTSSRKAR